MSGGDRFSYSSAPVRRISSIQFGILDPDFIVRDKDIMYLYNTSTNAFVEGWVLWVLWGLIIIAMSCRDWLLWCLYLGVLFYVETCILAEALLCRKD
jgi:hypothetical protein